MVFRRLVQKQLAIPSLLASYLSGQCNKVLETLLYSYRKPEIWADKTPSTVIFRSDSWNFQNAFKQLSEILQPKHLSEWKFCLNNLRFY